MLAIVNSRSLSCDADGQGQFDTIRFRYASMSVWIIAPPDAEHNVIRALKPGSPSGSYWGRSGPSLRGYALPSLAQLPRSGPFPTIARYKI